jgi:hypothetical protein
MNYWLYPCVLCDRPLSYNQVREAVYWLPRVWGGMMAMLYWGEAPEFRFAHRRCWKALPEKRKRSIRECCELKHEPMSLGQNV